MSKLNVKKICLSALFAAIVLVSTFAIRIPMPMGGYVNAGDTAVLLSGVLLGPLWGAVSAAVGSALADASAGYYIYVPATIVIKALVAVSMNKLSKRHTDGAILWQFIYGLLAELIMIAGYFLYEALVIGYGLAALANIFGNTMQAVFGAAAVAALIKALRKIPVFQDISDRL